MRITFLRPNLGDFRSRDAMEPLVFALLAARTDPHVDLSFYDERIAPIPLDLTSELVATTVETYTACRAYQIAAQHRRRGIPVVMGGYHATLPPDEVEQYCEAVVIGDAEGIGEQLVDDARRGCLMSRYRAASTAPLTGMRPDRRLSRGMRFGLH